MALTGTESKPKIRIVFHNEGLLRSNDLVSQEFLFGKYFSWICILKLSIYGYISAQMTSRLISSASLDAWGPLKVSVSFSLLPPFFDGKLNMENFMGSQSVLETHSDRSGSKML